MSVIKPFLVKESFLDYLTNPNYNNTSLANHFYYFFELNSKITDQMKMEDYKQVMETLVVANPRIWAVASFRFWDIDQDGIISIHDLFTTYKLLDDIESKMR